MNISFITAEDMANDADDKDRQKKGIINVNALHIYNIHTFVTAEDMANDADDKDRQKIGIINVNALHIYI